MDYCEVLQEQIQILSDWNKENKKTNPEQVRRNTETICTAITLGARFPMPAAERGRVTIGEGVTV